VLDVVNRRQMAQMAGRASVEFYVGLALKCQKEREKGKVIEEMGWVFISKLVSLQCTILRGSLLT
jgi:hypothetical protein